MTENDDRRVGQLMVDVVRLRTEVAEARKSLSRLWPAFIVAVVLLAVFLLEHSHSIHQLTR